MGHPRLKLRQALGDAAPDTNSVHVHCFPGNSLDEIDELAIRGPSREMIVDSRFVYVDLPSVATGRVGEEDRIPPVGAMEQDLTPVGGRTRPGSVGEKGSNDAAHGGREPDAGRECLAYARTSDPDLGRVSRKTHRPMDPRGQRKASLGEVDEGSASHL